MTTAQLDHLQLLKTHLTNLIENASKRTQGKWSTLGIAHGNAEAGWRSALAAISLLLNMSKRQHDIETAKAGFDAIESIRAAWPLELITKHQ